MAEITVSGLAVPFFDYGGLRSDYRVAVAAQLSEHRALTDPRLLYVTPAAAKAWIRRSARISPNSRLMREYRRAVEFFVAPLVTGDILSIVDLGVGDFFRSGVVLRAVLAAEKRHVHYAMVDISEYLLRAAVEGDIRSADGVLQRIAATGSVIALRLDFLELAEWRHLLPEVSPRYFMLLGNTLANEVDDRRSLACVAEAMRSDDLLFLEVQLREANPLTEDELSERFRENIEFYAEPLVALGYSQQNIDVFARVEVGDKVDVVSVHCFVQPLTATAAAGNPNPMGEAFQVMKIRKYTADGVHQLLQAAGLELLSAHASEPSEAMPIVMGYFSAKRSQ